jgi:hypothetical protein
MGLMALSMEDTKEEMLERIELEVDVDDGLGSGDVASGCFRGETSAASGGAALKLPRLGDDIGFIALSREATREVMPDMNPPPPSDAPPLSFFFNKASAFACCFSAAAASLATCRRMNKRTVDM